MTPDQDVPVLVLDVTKAEADKILLTLDPITAMARRNNPVLRELAGRIKPGTKDFQKLAADLVDSGPLRSDKPPNTEAADELKEKWGTERNQAWLIGRHSMFIGDASSIQAANVDGIVTDPPYDIDARLCVDIMARWSNRSVMLSSDSLAYKLSGYWAFRFQRIWKKPTARLSFATAGGHHPVMFHSLILTMTADTKVSPGWQRPVSNYSSIVEIKGAYEDRIMGHGKNAAIFVEMMRGFGWSTIADPFLGTGASLLACEETGRTCVGVEINPATAAVALQRFSDAGLVPRLLSGSTKRGKTLQSRRRVRSPSQSDKRTTA